MLENSQKCRIFLTIIIHIATMSHLSRPQCMMHSNTDGIRQLFHWKINSLIAIRPSITGISNKRLNHTTLNTLPQSSPTHKHPHIKHSLQPTGKHIRSPANESVCRYTSCSLGLTTTAMPCAKKTRQWTPHIVFLYGRTNRPDSNLLHGLVTKKDRQTHTTTAPRTKTTPD